MSDVKNTGELEDVSFEDFMAQFGELTWFEGDFADCKCEQGAPGGKYDMAMMARTILDDSPEPSCRDAEILHFADGTFILHRVDFTTGEDDGWGYQHAHISSDLAVKAIQSARANGRLEAKDFPRVAN